MTRPEQPPTGVTSEGWTPLAVQPDADPDRAEHDPACARHPLSEKSWAGCTCKPEELRVAVEAVLAGWLDGPGPNPRWINDLRVVLGDPAGTLANVKAQTLRDAATWLMEALTPLGTAGEVRDRAIRLVAAEADRIEGER